MKIPAIHGIIDRRILVNYTADADVVKQIIPAPFRPKLYEGKAVVGICLIRLKNIKPKGMPDFIGVSSENAAHRIAVEWDEDGAVKEGVYVSRRDTSLWLNNMIGGRLFPGMQYLADFDVAEADGNYHISFVSSDKTSITVDAQSVETFDSNSIFKTLENASAFFEKGAVGYSPNKDKFDGLELRSYQWKMRPLAVTNVQSSFFENSQLFPDGSITFDNALLMEQIEHEWHSAPDK